MKVFTWVYVIAIEALILLLGSFVVETFHTTNYMRVHLHSLGWPPALILLFYLRKRLFQSEEDEQ